MIAEPGVKKKIKAGAVVCKEGWPGDCAYIIDRGEVEVSCMIGSRNRVLARLQTGDIFGEMALLGHNLRTATVICLQDCELTVISRDFIDRKLDEIDPLVSALIRLVLERFFDMRVRLINTVEEGHPDNVTTMVTDRSEGNYASLAKQTSSRVQLEYDFLASIEAHHFELYYQAVTDAKSSEICGFEALIRWNHPQHGLIMPDEFIPLAEETKLIIPLGNWIFEQAIADYSAFKQDFPELGFISINCSVKQFEDETLLMQMAAAIIEHDIDPQQVKFEITETQLVQDPVLAKTVLDSVSKMGLDIAIDDFGTGFSSLSYLHRFPINTLKIDRSFVNSMEENQRSMEIIRSIILLARGLNMKVIAEGVETVYQHQQLLTLGCDYCQGYLISKPIPKARAVDLLQTRTGLA